MTQTFRIRNPEDMLAVVPVVLGFHPTDSLVMLTFPARGRGFHARVDLPRDEAGRDEAACSLVDAAVSNDIDRVAFVAYVDDEALAARALLATHDRFDAEDLDVVDLLWAHAPAWESLLSGRHGSFDTGSHPFTARAVVEGRVTHASRSDLEATIAPVAEQVEACRFALAALEASASDVARATETVLSHVEDGTRLADGEVARLVAATADDAGWTELWMLPAREDARHHAALWADVVRRCPEELVAGPAALLGHTAWLTGDGALAWCAVDRCRAVEPGHPGAVVVAELLEQAVPPSRWQRGLQEPA